MNNVPVIKIGIVAVSRDCFPESLAVNRRKAVVAEYEKKFVEKNIKINYLVAIKKVSNK